MKKITISAILALVLATLTIEAGSWYGRFRAISYEQCR